MNRNALKMIGGSVACALALVVTPTAARAEDTGAPFDIAAALSIPELAGLKVDTSQVKLDNAKATPTNLRATYQDPHVAYVTKLTNRFSINQSMASLSANFSTTDTITTTVERGIKNVTGASASVGFTAGFFNASVSANWQLESALNYSESKSTTKTHTWILPPQTVVVPAKTTALVRAMVQDAVFSGDVALDGDLTGAVSFTNYCGETYSMPVGQVLALRKNDGNLVTPSWVVPNGDVAKFSGKASFSGVAGAVMDVDISPADDATPGQTVARATTKLASSSAVAPVAPAAAAPTTQTVNGTAARTFSQLADTIKCGSPASTAGHSYVLGADGRISFVANGVAVVSPASVKFTSVTGDSANGNSYALGIAADGSVWYAHDRDQMVQVSGLGRAKAVAGHAFVLGEDGRVSFIERNRATVISPSSVTFTSISGDGTNRNTYALAIATDGSVWKAQDGNQMTQITLPGRAKATAGHGYVLGEDGRISYVADGSVTTVSPASAKFTSVSADWAAGNNYALAITTDGSVWMTQDGNQMKEVPLYGRAKATAGHGFVLGEDGRLTYVATFWWNGGTTVVSPSTVKFTSVTGDWENNNIALAVATDGSVWAARDANTMQKIAMPSAQ